MGYLRRKVLLSGIANKEVRDYIENTEAIFRINNVAEYFFTHDCSKWHDFSYPNVAPPFQCFWMEYDFPRSTWENGAIVKTLADKDLQVGCSFYVTDAPEGSICKWAIMMYPFSSYKPDEIIGGDICFELGIRQDGIISQYYKDEPGMIVHSPNNKGTKREDGAFAFENKILGGLAHQVHAFFLAISFLHCKNVETVERDLYIPRKERKPKDYFEKYHILKIDRMKRVLSSEGKSESSGLKNALHVCRGHFKDFSKGGGLFGKYTGMYWWDSQVRGSKQVGIVNKDYEVTTRGMNDND